MTNIPSTNTDPQYRYKMPKIVSKVEGRGNGIKTCVVNMGDVARALYRPPQYTTKWFGNELGAQSNYTNKEGEGERAVINGSHETHVFQTLLDKFIEKYVLCPNCNLPEIPIQIKKNIISAKCAACGWSGELDNAHRLAAFITKNPPDGKGGVVNLTAQGAGGDDKKARRAAKLAARQAGGADDDKEDGDDDDDDDDAPKKDKKEKKEKKEKKDKKDKKEKKEKKKKERADSDDDGSDDDVKVKKEKKEKKEKKDKKDKKEKKEKKEKKDKKEKKEKKKKDSDSDAGSGDEKSDASSEKDGAPLEFDDDEIKSTIKSMAEFVESKGGKPTVAAFFEEVRALQVTKVFDHKVRLYAVLESLFAGSMDGKGVSDKSKIIDKFITNGSLETPDVLFAFGAYLEANKGWDSAKRFPPIVKALYDEEWCTEKGILAYYNDDGGDGQPGFDKAKAAAKPFLTWLAQDDGSDSEEESEEESD